MLKRILLGGVALASLAGLPAHAATTITQKNCVVYSSAPTSGSPASALVPCDFLTDGINVWPAFLPWDGTTFAGVAPANTAATAAQGGLVVTMEPNSAALAVTGTFWQATQPISGTVAATESGTWNITNVSGTVSLPTGAATATLQTTGNTALTTINTTLGSPFQAGGSIGNTSFTANAGTNLNTSALATDAHLTAVQSAPGIPQTTAVTIQGNAGGVPVPISGSVSASFSSFTPTPSYSTPITVGATSTRQALPTGATAVIYNTGGNPAFVTIGNTSVTATASDDVVSPNCWIAYAVGSAVDIAAIETAGATTLNVSGGSGAPSGGCFAPTNPNGQAAAGASSPIVGATGTIAGGSTGTAGTPATTVVTMQGISGGTAVPVAATLNATPSLANGNGVVPTQGGSVLSATNGGYTNVLQGNAVLSATNGLYGNLLQGNAALTNANPIFSGLSISGAAVSATNGEYTNLLQGNAVIASGNPIFSQLTAGSANIGALTAGSAIIGKVGIDQTTPGTTNGVQVNAALPAGTNLMGKVGIDQTTPGTTNAVAPSTPVGSATLATGQSAGFTTSTLIVAARTGAPGTGRHNVTITNLGTVDTYCGNTGVTTSTGELLVGIKGASITLDSTAAIYCAAGSSSTVSYVETY